MLLTKLVPASVGREKVHLCKSGDRVALVTFTFILLQLVREK